MKEMQLLWSTGRTEPQARELSMGSGLLAGMSRVLLVQGAGVRVYGFGSVSKQGASRDLKNMYGEIREAYGGPFPRCRSGGFEKLAKSPIKSSLLSSIWFFTLLRYPYISLCES